MNNLLIYRLWALLLLFCFSYPASCFSRLFHHRCDAVLVHFLLLSMSYYEVPPLCHAGNWIVPFRRMLADIAQPTVPGSQWATNGYLGVVQGAVSTMMPLWPSSAISYLAGHRELVPGTYQRENGDDCGFSAYTASRHNRSIPTGQVVVIAILRKHEAT